MADMQPVNIPKPPANANVDEIHQWATSLNIWLGQNMGSGLQTTLLSSNQLSEVTGKEHAAKMFYNNDTHTFHGAVIDSGNLVVKQFTLT